MQKNSLRFRSVFTAKTGWISHVSIYTFNIKCWSSTENAASTLEQMCRTHLGFSEEELQVSATQNAVVLHIAGNVHSAGPVHGAVDLHVVVYGV